IRGCCGINRTVISVMVHMFGCSSIYHYLFLGRLGRSPIWIILVRTCQFMLGLPLLVAGKARCVGRWRSLCCCYGLLLPVGTGNHREAKGYNGNEAFHNLMMFSYISPKTCQL